MPVLPPDPHPPVGLVHRAQPGRHNHPDQPRRAHPA